MWLWLIRHAKSDWTGSAASDFERPLNQRAKRDGPRMQQWLQSGRWPAEWIWSSGARRARATAEYVAAAFPEAKCRTHPDLYGASADTLLAVIRETPAEVQGLAIVAHNPGLTTCINRLAGQALLDNLPTFGAALLQCLGPPEAVRFGAATLTTWMSPRSLPADGLAPDGWTPPR